MFLTVHSSVGAVIGNSTGNPVLAFVLGFLSHFLLDKIPHYEPSKLFAKAFRSKERPKKEVMLFLLVVFIDTALWMSLAWYLVFSKTVNPVPILAGMVGSVAPDYLFGLSYITKSKILKWFNKIHLKNHFDPIKTPVNFVTGSLTQLAFVAVSFKILFF